MYIGIIYSMMVNEKIQAIISLLQAKKKHFYTT